MGPLVQCISVLLISYFNIEVEEYFYTYHKFILIFNLLPIYPLDGGKLVNLLLSYLISYYQSLQKTIYISFFLYTLLTLYVILWQRNLIIISIVCLLGLKIIKEIKQADYNYHKFLMERYLNNYNFKKNKTITDIKQMKRDCNHCIFYDKKIIKEKEILSTHFSYL